MKNLHPRLDAEESKFLTKIMTLGVATNLPVVMTPGELVKLIGVVYRDTGMAEQIDASFPGISAKIVPNCDYYSISDDWFEAPIQLDAFEHVKLMRLGIKQIPDFLTYLRCLSELHKRRRKYAMILSAQPMPAMVQVSPRALIEYGRLDTAALASWLTWRKFFYDIDNRSAQETGYLFEPILAAAIGGESKGARARVVKRTGDDNKGRQVDCWKIRPDGKPLAYEFKLRVTIAASGQGRFGEELQFAEDCANSGAIPVLVVLDPTPNPRLHELQAEFEAKGGHAYIGDAAWTHLEEEAGGVMATFIERYVRKPISEISSFDLEVDEEVNGRRIKLLDFEARLVDGSIIFKIGKYERLVARVENENFINDEPSPNEE
ncbi:hypothetical protein MASR1M59_08960 [Melaminivora sp.]